MPASDDYAPPAPLWLVALAAVIALDNGSGVSGTALAAECSRRMPGRFQRATSVFDVVRRMEADGTLLIVRRVKLFGAAHATYYAPTEAGLSMFFAGRSVAESALRLPDVDASDSKKKPRKTKAVAS